MKETMHWIKVSCDGDLAARIGRAWHSFTVEDAMWDYARYLTFDAVENIKRSAHA